MTDIREKAARALWEYDWGRTFEWGEAERLDWLERADACLAACLVIEDEDVVRVAQILCCGPECARPQDCWACGTYEAFDERPRARATLSAFIARRLGK